MSSQKFVGRSCLSTLLIGLSLVLVVACAEDLPPELEEARIVVDGETSQTLEISHSGSNFFNEDVPESAIVVLHFDEPVDLSSVSERIELTDGINTVIPIEVTQRLMDIHVAPSGGMTGGQNYVLVVDNGIEDESGNGTLRAYNITFYVAAP